MFEVHILACKHELHAQELNPTSAKPQRILNKRMKREREREKQNVKERCDQRTIFPYYHLVCVMCMPFFERTGERGAHLFWLKWTAFRLLLTEFESLVHSHNVLNHSRNVFASLSFDVAGSCEE